MNLLMGIEWTQLLGFTMPVAEIVIRGTAIYWFLFIVFRFLIRRDVGAVGIADLLLLVIVADASQNAMAGGYHSVSEGMVLIATLIGWNILFDWLSYRFPGFRRFAEPAALCLVKNGRLLRRNMRREFITEDELWQALREHGIDSLHQVRQVMLEPDGNFSVVRISG